MRSNQISGFDAYKKLLETNFFGTEDLMIITLRLAKTFKVSEKKVAAALGGLVRDGILVTGRDGKTTTLKNNVTKTTGVFHDSKGKGKYGFITVEGYESDLYIPDAGSAKEGDIVELSIINGRGKNGEPKAILGQVIERQKESLIGVVRKTKQGTYVFKPDGEQGVVYAIPQDGVSKEAEGKKCSLKVSMFASTKDNMGVGAIEKTFGFAEDPIAENGAIAYQFGFSKEFPKEVMDEVAKIPQEVTPEDMKGRLDLRHIPFTAWDPEGCKDKDDAMYVEKTKYGYKAYIAIADVSHYVKPGSAIDKEAYLRGTSCYLGDGVYPMLPPELSNGICSLNEGTDRLAHVAIVDIDENGEILHFDFKKSVIHIAKSLAYEEAEAIHTGALIGYEDIKPEIDLLYEAHDVLKKKLSLRGAISFKSKEPTFGFNEDKTNVVDVVNKGDDESHSVVEQMMLLANEAGAIYLQERFIGGLYRVHEKPRADKIATVNNMLKALEIEHTLDASNSSYQTLTKKIANSKYEDFITSLALRSMAKAKYQPENVGHFGLASPEYLHFTSPIRRYPDLVCHRAIANREMGLKEPYTKAELVKMGEHLSEQERKAESAEVQSDKLLCAYWANNHVGEIFDGYVSSLSQGAIDVRVGMVTLTVPLMNLAGGESADYRLNKTRTALVDRYSGAEYKLADDISVKISEADIENKVIYATTDLTQTQEVIETQTEGKHKQTNVAQTAQAEDKGQVK